MVEISESEYNKLRKDADDNKQLKHIVLIIAITLIVIILFFTIGAPFISRFNQRQDAIVQNELRIEQAYNNVEIFKIEKGNMSIDDYVKWKSVNQDTN